MDDQRDESFGEFVERWEGEIRRAWDSLPEGTRSDLTRTLGLLPADLRGWRGLIDQAVEQVQLAVGEKHQVAIVGPVNVGKSTLYNALVRAEKDRAAVSALPGTTRRSQTADAGLFIIVDTPGADAAGEVGEEEKERALTAARGADLLVLLFDASHGIGAAEQALFAELKALEKPTVVALNKIDLVARERAAVLGKAAATLGLSSDQLIPLSAKKGQGFDTLLLAIAKSEPQIVAALGAALPEYRWKLTRAVVARAASTAAAIAVTPLPFLDFFPLLGIQAAMVLGISRIYAYQITPARARELMGTFGVAVLGRTLFYELSKLGGPPGWLLAAAIAAGTTVALGYASAAWFDRGERVSRQTLERITRAVSETVIERLKGIGRRKPQRATLRQRIDEALQDLPSREEAVGEPVSGDEGPGG